MVHVKSPGDTGAAAAGTAADILGALPNPGPQQGKAETDGCVRKQVTEEAAGSLVEEIVKNCRVSKAEPVRRRPDCTWADVHTAKHPLSVLLTLCLNYNTCIRISID